MIQPANFEAKTHLNINNLFIKLFLGKEQNHFQIGRDLAISFE